LFDLKKLFLIFKSRLKQKDDTISKYQDMLKLARDEITNINKQHELEITNMLDKLNLTRDSNLKKLKQDLKSNTSNRPETMTKVQVIKILLAFLGFQIFNLNMI
jgi:hypothetical protein